jgi:hypothetical protein
MFEFSYRDASLSPFTLCPWHDMSINWTYFHRKNKKISGNKLADFHKETKHTDLANATSIK